MNADRWDCLVVLTLVGALLACGGGQVAPEEAWYPLVPALDPNSGARVAINGTAFAVPQDCLCARRLGGDEETRKVGGDEEARKLGGDEEARKLGGDEEARKLGGDEEARKLGGDEEARKLGSADAQYMCNPASDCNLINVKGLGVLPLMAN